MGNFFSSTNQIVLFLIFFNLVVFLLAFFTDKFNGLFLARNPFDTESYKATPENENERKAGKLFVKWTYTLVPIFIPCLLILYNNLIAKILGIIFIIVILIYRRNKKL